MASILKLDTLQTPSGTGVITSQNTIVSPGHILQVVRATTTTPTSTTSTTYTDVTGFAATITPLSANSKILITIDYSFYIQADNVTRGGIQLLRNSTILVTDAWAASDNVNANVAHGSRSSMSYLDTPATVSATTYKVQFARVSSVGTSYNFTIPASTPSTANITLMEIAQ